MGTIKAEGLEWLGRPRLLLVSVLACGFKNCPAGFRAVQPTLKPWDGFEAGWVSNRSVTHALFLFFVPLTACCMSQSAVNGEKIVVGKNFVGEEDYEI